VRVAHFGAFQFVIVEARQWEDVAKNGAVKSTGFYTPCIAF